MPVLVNFPNGYQLVMNALILPAMLLLFPVVSLEDFSQMRTPKLTTVHVPDVNVSKPLPHDTLCPEVS